MRRVYLVALLAAVSCSSDEVPALMVDADKDGFPLYADCDDQNELINPDAIEMCDGFDNDCDGSIDEPDADDATPWYADTDGDGVGDDDAMIIACPMQRPAGYVADPGDCNDADLHIYPGAPEDDCADPVDYNCDGEVQYADADEDGFAACEDCDDVDPSANPQGVELCDEVDNDCDGVTDPETSLDAAEWFADMDGDGFGDPDDSVMSCAQPADYVDNADDCDDDDENVHPDGVEVCGGGDEDCDGELDVGAEGAATWYRDTDGDGYGATAVTMVACEQPTGYVDNADDCDDTDDTASPDGSEVCDGADNDCNGTVDDGAPDAKTWYLDADWDGFGDAATPMDACTQPDSYVADDTDCDDMHSDVFPGATEYCDDVDHDCDGDMYAGAVDAGTWYLDLDDDGYGVPQVTAMECTMPAGYAVTADDCNDNDAAISPVGIEVCDTIDNNCDGTVDEDDAVDAPTWWKDEDWDGFGNAALTTTRCFAPPHGYVDNPDDCNDDTETVNPAALEYCNDIDDNCDTTVDEDTAVDAPVWYEDSDGDEFGNAAVTTNSCSQPAGFVPDWHDCDDTQPTDYPGADEYCDGRDNDCDSVFDEPDAVDATTWYYDGDSDGFGDQLVTRPACFNPPAGYVDDAAGYDCFDGSAAANPLATEVCDGLDNDCDGVTDDSSAADAITWYRDADGDSHGDANHVIVSCTQPVGYLTLGDDCDDTEPYNHPGNTEICDYIDNNCDGNIDEAPGAPTTWYRDADGDEHGNPLITMVSCENPPGFLAAGDDCDDANADRYPGNPEICDYFDNNCDNVVDEGVTYNTFYADADGDNYPSATASINICEPDPPPGFLPAPVSIFDFDCADGINSTNPGATDVCDGVDNDCDAVVDNNGIDSDGDLLDNCNDPTVWDFDFQPCRAGSNNLPPGWEVRKYEYVQCCVFPTGQMPLPVDVTGCPTVCSENDPGLPDCNPGDCPQPPEWDWGCSSGGRLFSGVVGMGHSAVLGPDHGQLNVFTISVDITTTFSNLDTAGFIFDWEDAGTYWMIRWDDPINSYVRGTVLEFIRCVGGACTKIDVIPVAAVAGGTIRFQIRVNWDQIEVWAGPIGGLNLLTSFFTNGDQIGPGRVGLYTFDADSGIYFGNLVITQP